MADPVRIDTSFRLPVAAPAPEPVTTPIDWFADDPAAERHAWPRRDGFPPPSMCGLRFTTRYGKHGTGVCLACLQALRDQVVSATAAIAEGEAEARSAGDHFAYPVEAG